MRNLANTGHPEPINFTDLEQSLALLGPSGAIERLTLQVRRLAPHLRTLLIRGGQDCGQEAIARLLLLFSSHPSRHFVSVHSSEAERRLSSVTDELPSEMFLFLSDADRLSMTAQEHVVNLLKRQRKNKMTIVAATSEDLPTLASAKRYLPALAAALGNVSISVPALKDRVEDIPMLLNQLIELRCQSRQQSVPKIAKPFLDAAMHYEWPGNFAELSQVVNYLLDKERKNMPLGLSEWTRAITAQQTSMQDPGVANVVSLNTVIKQHIYGILLACEGNKQRAAKILGVSRSTLYRFMGKVEHSGLHSVQ